MHTDRVIVRTNRFLYGLSTIPDGLNTLTLQSVDTNDVPGNRLQPHYRPETGSLSISLSHKGMVGQSPKII